MHITDEGKQWQFANLRAAASSIFTCRIISRLRHVVDNKNVRQVLEACQCAGKNWDKRPHHVLRSQTRRSSTRPRRFWLGLAAPTSDLHCHSFSNRAHAHVHTPSQSISNPELKKKSVSHEHEVEAEHERMQTLTRSISISCPNN
jgi:hypothetical protein